MHKPFPTLISLAALLLAAGAQAKLPAPSDEAKAKAAEAAAKTAWSGKVDAYKLCVAQDKLAASYRAGAKKAGKDVGATTDTPACADPGPFVYTPPAPASAPAAAPATAPAPAKKG